MSRGIVRFFSFCVLVMCSGCNGAGRHQPPTAVPISTETHSYDNLGLVTWKTYRCHQGVPDLTVVETKAPGDRNRQELWMEDSLLFSAEHDGKSSWAALRKHPEGRQWEAVFGRDTIDGRTWEYVSLQSVVDGIGVSLVLTLRDDGFYEPSAVQALKP